MKKSSFIENAEKLLKDVSGKQLEEKQRIDLSIELAANILEEANRSMSFAEKSLQNQLARMMQGPNTGKVFTTSFTDQCFRSKRFSRVADQVCYLIDTYGVPAYFSFTKRLGLKMFRLFGKILPFIFVPATIFLLKRETASTIVSATGLKKHIKRRKEENVRCNINRLGEALLGEGEAKARLEKYLKDIKDPSIDYISIKISTIYSQINLLAEEKTLRILSERLSLLYQAAIDYSSNGQYKFVNLDMEEYKDLIITKNLFMRVLDMPQFKNYRAGIVLQAYLPDSFAIQKELTEWAKKRVKAGGAPIKIRIVKGANLQAEQSEASLNDWPQPQYKTKAEVDANYKRMVSYGCISENAEAVTIGIGSHNLFDIAYALVLREERGLQNKIVFEMLEGMADSIRKVVGKLAGGILLYCPVASKEDFQNAVAYLIRRLDENTGSENFLRHSWGLKAGTAAFKEQAERFRNSVLEKDHVSAISRKKQDRASEKVSSVPLSFANDVVTDFSLVSNQKWALSLVENAKNFTFEKELPKVIDEKEASCCLDTAKKAGKTWSSKSCKERADILKKAALHLSNSKETLFKVLLADGGKTLFESDPEICEAIDFTNFYADRALELENSSEIEWSPLGTILVASPWNFPLAIPCGGIIGALAAGNAVLFKPAPETVLVGWVLTNILWDAGIPKDVLQFIRCPDDPVGSFLIKDERVDAVILTGSTATAKKFLEMRPSLHLAAETGGKNSLIVTAMADRDLAIKDLLVSAFGHSGQKCSAASLLILEKEVYDDQHFLESLKDAVESLTVASAFAPDAKIVPLVGSASPDFIKGATTLEEGEKWLVLPRKIADNFWTPGVKLGVKEGSFSHKTEFFGPLLSVMRAENLSEAIRFANGSSYGLTSGLHSLDMREQNLWIDKIEAGNLYINRSTTGAIVNRQPFGGIKASSFGEGRKAGGYNYVCQFAKAKEKQKSSKDYATWMKEYFNPKKDFNLLIGQDNIQFYKPLENMALYIQEGDSQEKIERVLAALKAAGVPLNVVKNLKEIESGLYRRVRTVSKPSEALLHAAALCTTPCHIVSDEPLSNGRFELLHYLQEYSLSVNYHRYGYLGIRENDKRSPIQ